MREVIDKIYKQFCQETKRNGGVLIHSSIGEWHEYLTTKLDQMYDRKEKTASSDEGLCIV